MAHSGLAAFIRWQGQFYHVRWSVIDASTQVQVDPENTELELAARESIEQDTFKQLAVYKGFGYDYLMSDVNRGE